MSEKNLHLTPKDALQDVTEAARFAHDKAQQALKGGDLSTYIRYKIMALNILELLFPGRSRPHTDINHPEAD